MEQKEIVSYIAFEGEMTRMERTNHRLFILCICMLVALLVTNGYWIYYESQFETVETTTSETYEAQADNGSNAIINSDGEVNINGESEEN